MSDFSLDCFSAESKTILIDSQKFADQTKSRYLFPLHILFHLLSINEIKTMLKSFGVDLVALNASVNSMTSDLIKSKKSEESSMSPDMEDLFARANARSKTESKLIGVFDLIYLIAQDSKKTSGGILLQFNVSPERIAEYLDMSNVIDIDASQYFINLSVKKDDDVIIGRDDEVRRIIQILGRRHKHHPILVGESGVGKRTIVLALVDRILNNNVPKNLENTTIVQLDTNALFFGVKQKHDVETRLKAALSLLGKRPVIVYIRSMDMLSANGVSANDVFQVLFAYPNVKIITATTPSSFKKFSDKDSALGREFTHINIEPTSEQMAIEILRGISSGYEKHHAIKISENCICTAVKFAKRHVQDRWLPESAIDLIDEAAANQKMEVNGLPYKLDKARSRIASIDAQLKGLAGNDDEHSLKAIHSLQSELNDLRATYHFELNNLPSTIIPSLTEESIARVLGEWTGIPVSKFLEGDTDKVSKMEDRLAKKVIDQEEAVKAIVEAIKRSRSGLRKQSKPIGSFIFFGSSGVGKTLLAKAVAGYLFDSEENFIRIDMSEFQEKHMVSRLLGAPPGYANSDDGGFLTEAVKKRPYSVILFDEIEKAHQDVFNILLQVLDDGRLSDSKGRVVDFSNTIIILTSNLGSRKILAADPSLFDSKEGVEAIRDKINEDVNNFFRPEFLNRIDCQVIFKPLSKLSLSAIADIEFNWLEKMLSDRRIKINITPTAKTKIVEMSYFPAFGARPLHRTIMQKIQNPLSELLLQPDCTNGSKILIDLNSKEEFVLSLN